MRFKKGVKAEIGSKGGWNAVQEGYLLPSAVLEDQQLAKQVDDAIDLVERFLQEAYQAGVIEEA